MDSLLFSSNFRYATAADFTKTKAIMHPELNSCYRSNGYETTEQLSKQEDQQRRNMTGYQSGPSTTSFLDALCDDSVGPGYLERKTSSVEEMDFNSRFGCGDGAADFQASNKEVVRDSGHLVYEAAGDVVVSSKNIISSANCSNLIRHSSSPAGFLSNLAEEIGFTETNNVGNIRPGSKTNTESNSTSSRLDGYLANGQQDGISNRHYVPNFLNDPTFNSLKRNRDGEVKMLTNLNQLDAQAYQNDDSKHYTSGLVHQLSMPSTFAEMATMENLMDFQQDSTPCKIRAKRGFATHPRSIAERVRRTRISARMKKLQDLFPNMDKQANTADMLDLAVLYIKDLQKEVQTLNETRAKCTCPSKT
ncbi:Transcription factor bHLH81 [Heracleum sosnowskyi]|uniref:Transcription factor bHLH81 n=1 Tax=Heracleum sosnowskyi TaxID=360622 RepID=A0AAD8IBN1_9APIA|nr:Transcription factor bHLH81 [Heracleum sosnowskyi]